jgi:hypothetical protein
MAKETERSPRDAVGNEMSEAEIDRTLAASFPASDPPSWTLGTDHSDERSDGALTGAEDEEGERGG